MSTDRDEDGSDPTGTRTLRCGACDQVFETCHDPAIVYCPTCGYRDVRPVDDA